MDSHQVRLDSLEDLLDVMAVGNPVMQRMLSERRAALGMPPRDPQDKENAAPQAENVAAVSTEAGGNGLKKNAVADLLRDLECFYPILQEGGSGHKGTETNVEFSVGEVNLEKMIVQENTEERGQEITVQKETEWAVINGGTRSSPISDMVNGEASSSSVSATETVVSPSRFTVLTTLDEDIEDTEVEEGEVVSENEHIGIADSERPKDKEEHHNRRGKSVSVAAQKSTKKKGF
ncbi:hypothetical protein YC2023_041143 [Brassica napus]